MSFTLVWQTPAVSVFNELKAVAEKSIAGGTKKKKPSKQAGLFKQVVKCLEFLAVNPRHPGLNTHAYTLLKHPYDADGKVFEAYVQNRTPGAYRVFWCYGPDKKQITIIAITPHP